MKYINSIIILILFLCSCTQIRSNEKYRKDLKLFPQFLIDIFPQELSTPFVSSLNVDTTSKCIYYQLYVFNVDTTILNVIKSENWYKPNDSLLISIKRQTLFDWNYKQKTYYHSIVRNNEIYYPILFFEKNNLVRTIKNIDLFSENSESGLNNEFQIFVLESKPGTYWKGLKPLDYMPKGWQNGYSKGVCVDKSNNVMIYWFVIW